jgi:hypothetical protein
MSKTTQKEKSFLNMANGRTISPWYAIEHLGNTRLAATIFTLKQDGHNISSETVKSKNKFGDEVSYSIYKLIQD